MPYGQNQKKDFHLWLLGQTELIKVAVREGLSKKEAIEMLKAWELHKLVDVLRYK